MTELPVTEAYDSAADSPAEGLPEVAGYRLEAELGRGGMGVVYRARHLALKRTVALKMILGAGHASRAASARFWAEAEAVARLQHPNIVQVFEVGQAGGLPYCALEFIDGLSLAHRLGDRPMPSRDAARLVEPLARAMHLVHSRNIVHRDLKPANVLLAADGAPKITDFGLARQLDADSGLTQSGSIVGTPSYMAPEQAAGEIDAVGPAADIYSLGAVLYECLTGRPPFKGATVLETLEQVRAGEPVPPRRLQPDVPPDLETICLKCLAKEPERRYGSALDLADDLGRFQRGEPVLARPVSTRERLVKWARRRPAAAALLAVSVLAALVLAVGAAYFTSRLADQNTQLTSQGEQLKEQSQQLAGKNKDLEEQIGLKTKAESDAKQQAKDAKEAKGKADEKTHLAQYQLARAEAARHAIQLDLALRARDQHDAGEAERILDEVGPSFQQTWENLYARNLCRRASMPCRGEGLKSQVFSLAFSADGRRMAAGGADRDRHTGHALNGVVKVWEVGTGRELLGIKAHKDEVLGVTFSSDGKRVLSAAKDGTVKITDISTGHELLSVAGHAPPIAALAISPDGQRIVSGSEDRTLTIWEVATGRQILVIKGHTMPVSCVAFSPDGRRIVSGGAGGQDRNFGEAKVWDAQTGREQFTLKLPMFGPNEPWGTVDCVAFSPDNKRIAASNERGGFLLWDAETGKEQLAPKRDHLVINRFALSPDGNRLVLGGGSLDKPGYVEVWDLSTGQKLSTLKGHPMAVGCVAFSRDGKHIVAGSWDDTVRVWGLETDRETASLTNVGRYVTAVAAEGRRVMTATGDGMVRMFDRTAGEPAFSFQLPPHGVTCAAFSADNKRLATASESAQLMARHGVPRAIQIWDAQTGQELFLLKGHTTPVSAVMFSANGERLVSVAGNVGGPPCDVMVWDARTGREKLRFRGAAGPIWSAALSPDGRRLAQVSWPALKVWDVDTGRETLSLAVADTGTLNCVAYSPDGKRLAAGGGDRNKLPGEVMVWDAETGEKLFTLKGHAQPVHSVAFSPDGQRLLSGGWDGAVKVWDIATGQDKLTLKGHAGVVRRVVFSSDGKQVVSIGDDGIKVWDTEPDVGGQPPVLFADLDAALEQQPGNSALWVRRALVRSRQGRFAEARADLDKAAVLAANDPAVTLARAVVDGRAAQPDKAQAGRDRAIRQIPPWTLGPDRAWEDRQDFLPVKYGPVADAVDALLALEDELTWERRAVSVSAAQALTMGTPAGLWGSLPALVVRPMTVEETATHWRLCGLARCARGDWPRAVADLTEALLRDPSDSAALQARAHAFAELGHWDKAIADGTGYLAAHPNSAEMYRVRAAAFRQSKKQAQALADLDEALARGGDGPGLRRERCGVCSALGRWDQVLSEADAVLAKQPDDVAILTDRARANEKLGRIDDAVADYLRAVAAAPDDGMLLVGLGRLYLRQKKLERADEVFLEAARRTPLLREQVPAAYREAGVAGRIVDYYARLVPLFPDDMSIREIGGILAIEFSRWPQAAAHYGQLLKEQPDRNHRDWFFYASACLLADDPDGYQKALAVLLKHNDPTTETFPFLSARACTLTSAPTKEIEQVIREAASVPKAKPDQFDALTAQAALEVRAGRYDKAVSHLRDCLAQQPKSKWEGIVIARLWLTLALQRQGKTDEARKEFAPALDQLERWGTEKPWRAPNGFRALSMEDWLETQVLRREVEKLLPPAKR